MDQERRKYSRIAFHAPATLIFPDRTLEVIVLDLSLKGALVRLPTGTAVVEQMFGRLRIWLDEMRTRIAMEVRIAHQESGNTGLCCLSIDLDSITHLRRLVEINLGDPALLDRELSELIVD